MTTRLLQAVRDTLGTLLGGLQVIGRAAGDHCRVAPLESDLGAASASPLPGHGGWADPGGAVGGGTPRISPAGTGGDGRLSGEDGGGDPADLCPWRVGPAESMPPQQLLNLLNRLGHPTKTRWNVRIMERYRHGAGVVTSLARSRRGGPLKTARLVADDGACVTFTSRARQEEADVGPASPHQMTLPVAAFLQRWLLHVPVPQTRVVRGYGLSQQTHAAALAVCRTALGQPPVEPPPALDWQTVGAQRGRPIRSGVPPAGSGSCALA